MPHFHKLLTRLAATSLLAVAAHTTQAQTQDLQKEVRDYFLQLLKTQQEAEVNDREAYTRNPIAHTSLQKPISKRAIATTQETVWAAWREANSRLQEQKLAAPTALQEGSAAAWSLPQGLESEAIMPYYYGSKGEQTGPLPLFIYLHGSGPKAQEWQTGLRLAAVFRDAPSLYFIPQIPNEGAYYRWWQLAKQFAWEKLLRQALAAGDADANRLYLFGISEGGYGSQRLASFYADYWAAAGPMAGGEPLKNAPVENCANIGFSFLTGADDTGFYRNLLTYYTQVAFDSAQLARPLSSDQQPLFRHRIHLLPGKQHHIDYRLTTPWLTAFTRNPYPKTVLWEDFEMDGRRRSGFYNLQVTKRPSEERTYYEMSLKDNVVTIDIRNVSYTTTEKDSRWGIDLRFHRTYSPAEGGRLRIFLNDRLVDMSRPVTLIINGRKVFQGRLKANLRDMIDSCAEYFDPCRVFPASVEVSY